MKISQILEKAENGDLECCSECFWSPKKNPLIAFGKSCAEHGLDWKSKNKVNSMYIVQDPGNTVPDKTGRLCAVHNSKNSSDKSAQQSNKLWGAAVSLEYDNPEANGYMKENYWTNAIMHGAGKSSNTENLRNKNIIESVANDFCSNVLKLQISALQPKVIIANGKIAVNSLYEIGILRKNWDILRHSFDKGAYQETIFKWNDMQEFTVFCTYHPAGRVVNQTLSREYKSKTEEYLKAKIDKLESKKAVNNFLQEYSTENATSKGMRYLLNHWLDIGEKIRKEYNKSFQPTANASAEFKR
jgi:uracil-DNA glycosylase